VWNEAGNPAELIELRHDHSLMIVAQKAELIVRKFLEAARVSERGL
jgi:hypothetical protein